MKGRAAKGKGSCVVGAVLILLAVVPVARADDVTTLSGRTLRQARMTRVEPDGVVWEHATGVSKVDFADLPEPLRQKYHYDAARAASYQAAQTRARAEAAAQAQEDQRKLAERRTQRFQQEQEAATVETDDPQMRTFSIRRERTSEKAAEAVGEQITAQKLAEARRTEYDGTLYDRRLWAIPQMIVGIHSDGHDFDPPDPGSDAYRRGLRRSPETRKYYEDVDRAEAFAKGRP